MKDQILKLGLVGAMALGIPAAAAAHGSGDASRGLDVAAQHSNGNSPTTVGQPTNTPDPGKPDTPGNRPQNHGWFVSQAAKNETLKAAGTNGTSTHGAAVAAVAKSDQGK